MTLKQSLIFAPALLLAATLSLVACDSDSGTSANGNEESAASHSEADSESTSSTSVDPESPQGDGPQNQQSSSSTKRSSSSQSELDSESTSSSSVDSQGDKSSSSSNNDDLIECASAMEGLNTNLDGVWYKCIDGYWIAQSSSSAASSSSYFDMTNQFSDKYSYGEFTDPRDGQVYKTITYEDGFWGIDSITIFAQNLNYGKMVVGGSVQYDSTKYCYNDDPWYCENGFGGLYSWSNAMNFPQACDSAGTGTSKCPSTFNLSDNGMTTHNSNYPENIDYVEHQGICPNGWHVMNRGDWNVLIQKAGGVNYYSSISGYYGSEATSFGENTYGFSLLPAGGWSIASSKFDWLNKKNLSWLHREYTEDSTYASYVDIENHSYSVAYYNYKRSAISVRCTKDY